MPEPEPSLGAIREARERLRGVAHHTTLRYSTSLSQLSGAELYLKLENLQKTGSFKIRGAYNRIATMSDGERAQGVIAASAGNHAQAVAYAASVYGLEATIVMPEGSPITKTLATRGYGATVILHGETYDDAHARAKELAESGGYTFVHPFDNPLVIAGQGTIGLEILEDLPEPEVVLVPIGGGGLISGIGIAVKEERPQVRLIGVEPEGAASALAAREAGHQVILEEMGTIADGLAAKVVGERTYPLIERYVDELVTVSEEEIAAAILTLMERKKIVAEGAGAAALAAVMNERVGVAGRRTVVVVSGGNIDVSMLARIIDKGMIKTGRLLKLEVEVRDVPGALASVTSRIAAARANVLDLYHQRLSREIPIGRTRIELHLETRGPEHNQEIVADLEEAGYRVRVLE